MNGELYFLDELNDSRVLEISHVIKGFLESQNIEVSDVQNWPPVFLARLQEIYKIRGELFNIENLSI